ncbi:hypothetical protein M8C13_05130 [Crossiella sp. SN42]|uniref:competence protein CoiA family protein n=1 Tax=Crossiella sp. SN42 TaxID=2944808 RepID=UPI00207D4316|nr:competence protein CoiA family protein [Crossiella sp. SN42]MCO1575141.1 hypothetical protein [Crossiella sp. SN42]
MAFAAIHPEAGRVDATRSDLGAGLVWEQVHKARPRVALTCPDCGHGVHAKVSPRPRSLRFFAHNPGRPTECAWDNESLEHHLLKLELATTIRALGWHAELEVRAPDGRWRADVLSSAHDGTGRVAWEVQLSPISGEDIAARTGRYAEDGIAVCWVGVAGGVSWPWVVPSLKVRAPDREGPWLVVDGVAGFDFGEGSWKAAEVSLPEALGWVLREQVFFHQVLPRYRRVLFGSGSAWRSAIWTTRRSVEAEGRHELMRQRQEKRKREQAEREHQEKLLRAHEEALAEDARRAEAERVRRAGQAQEEARWARRRRELDLKDQARREQEVRKEAERQRREKAEAKAAAAWWREVSPAQREELFALVRTAVMKTGLPPAWRIAGTRVQLGDEPAREHAYGVAVMLMAPQFGSYEEWYAVIRPSPASVHRLPGRRLVFVRNAGEVQRLIATGSISAERITHFDLPEGEQLSLL